MSAANRQIRPPASSARESLQDEQLTVWLEELERQDPELFLYVTASRKEFNEFAEKNPQEAGRVLDRVEQLPVEKLSQLNRMKKDVRRVRTQSPRTPASRA